MGGYEMGSFAWMCMPEKMVCPRSRAHNQKKTSALDVGHLINVVPVIVEIELCGRT